MVNTARKLRVLLLDDGRTALPFLKSLKRAGHHVTIACGGRLTCGYFSRYSDRRVVWCDYFKYPHEFSARMVDYVRRHRPDVTLAIGDNSVQMVVANRAELTRWTKVTVPEEEVYLRAADKAQTMAFCMENDIPCPRTYFPEADDLETVLPEMAFPVMVKPRRGMGAVGLHRIETAEALRSRYPAIKQKHGELLIQEFIPLEGGTQFQAEAFLDAESNMKVCLVIAKPRFFPVTGGTSCCNVTIHRPDIEEDVRRLLEGIEWVGAADVDLILDPRDNVPKILEVNPRVTAGIKIGFAAGIDYADFHMRLATGEPIPPVDSYKLGVCLRNLCMDCLWYLFSGGEVRRSTQPSFFKFFGRDVKYQTFSADDPMPLAGFICGMIKKYTSPGEWKTKLGRDLGP
ncbi:MAG: carboxylate--amine ligase [Planctomycetota bacterium]|jgi:predicted ATP-grasp superfamily ATP-dependent carboligase